MKIKTTILFLCLIIWIGGLWFAVGCESSFDLTIQNRTNQTFDIYYKDEVRVGVIKPGDKLVDRFISLMDSPYRYSAVNSKGESVFSIAFAWEDAKKAKYSLVITDKGFSLGNPEVAP